jgi:hypothetical protein
MNRQKKQYIVVCGRCYSCHIGYSNRKKDAEVLAVSHLNTFKHETWVVKNTESHGG